VSQKYDHIGIEYDVTRKADPEIARRIHNHLQVIEGSSVVDIGCGSGNYTIALQQMGLEMTGTDISSTMVDSAKLKNHDISWIRADANELPVEDSAFKGAISTLVIHHFEELEGPFREAYRVISEGRFVIFTSSPVQMRNYWLVEYFPKAMEASFKQMPPLEKVRTLSLMERVVQDKAADCISLCRPFICEPELVNYWKTNKDRKPKCSSCNKCVEGIYKGRPIDCILKTTQE